MRKLFRFAMILALGGLLSIPAQPAWGWHGFHGKRTQYSAFSSLTVGPAAFAIGPTLGMGYPLAPTVIPQFVSYTAPPSAFVPYLLAPSQAYFAPVVPFSQAPINAYASALGIEPYAAVGQTLPQDGLTAILRALHRASSSGVAAFGAGIGDCPTIHLRCEVVAAPHAPKPGCSGGNGNADAEGGGFEAPPEGLGKLMSQALPSVQTPQESVELQKLERELKQIRAELNDLRNNLKIQALEKDMREIKSLLEEIHGEVKRAPKS